MIRSIADLQQMKEAYLEKMGQYTHLCMVCYGTGCMSSGCKNVRDAMVEELEKAGLSDKGPGKRPHHGYWRPVSSECCHRKYIL